MVLYDPTLVESMNAEPQIHRGLTIKFYMDFFVQNFFLVKKSRIQAKLIYVCGQNCDYLEAWSNNQKGSIWVLVKLCFCIQVCLICKNTELYTCNLYFPVCILYMNTQFKNMRNTCNLLFENIQKLFLQAVHLLSVG